METAMMKERQAYEDTKFQLEALKLNVRKLKKKNRKEQRTQRQIDFLIN